MPKVKKTGQAPSAARVQRVRAQVKNTSSASKKPTNDDSKNWHNNSFKGLRASSISRMEHDGHVKNIEQQSQTTTALSLFEEVIGADIVAHIIAYSNNTSLSTTETPDTAIWHCEEFNNAKNSSDNRYIHIISTKPEPAETSNAATNNDNELIKKSDIMTYIAALITGGINSQSSIHDYFKPDQKGTTGNNFFLTFVNKAQFFKLKKKIRGNIV